MFAIQLDKYLAIPINTFFDTMIWEQIPQRPQKNDFNFDFYILCETNQALNKTCQNFQFIPSVQFFTNNYKDVTEMV